MKMATAVDETSHLRQTSQWGDIDTQIYKTMQLADNVLDAQPPETICGWISEPFNEHSWYFCDCAFVRSPSLPKAEGATATSTLGQPVPVHVLSHYSGDCPYPYHHPDPSLTPLAAKQSSYIIPLRRLPTAAHSSSVNPAPPTTSQSSIHVATLGPAANQHQRSFFPL